MKLLKLVDSIYNKFSAESKDSLLYLIFSVVAYGISFLQNFLFAWLVPLSFYGEITLAYSIYTLAMAIFMFGLSAAITRFYFDSTNFTYNEVISNISASWLIIGSIISILGSSFIYVIYYFFTIEKISIEATYLLFFGGFLYSFFECFSSIYPAQKKPIYYGMYLVFNRSVLFISILLCVLFLENTIYNIALGYFYSSLFIFISGVFVFRKNITLDISLTKIKSIIKFSSPLALNTLGNLGFSQGFKILISPFISFEQLGLFDIASKISNISYLVGTSVAQGNLAKVYETLEKFKKIESINFYRNQLLKISGASAISTFIFSIAFLYFFKNGVYFESIYVIPSLLIGQSILLIYSYYYIYFTFIHSTKSITITVISGAFCSLLFAYLFVVVLQWGIIGGSIASLLGYSTQFFLAYYLSKKNTPSAF